MAVRTDATKVGKIIEVESGVDLNPFIEVANELVTECCVGKGYTETRLTQIETWLAAHFYAIYDPRAVSEMAKGVGQRIESRVDLGFDVTRHGQMAMRLDTAGGLTVLNKKSKDGTSRSIGVTWVGTPADENDADEET